MRLSDIIKHYHKSHSHVSSQARGHYLRTLALSADGVKAANASDWTFIDVLIRIQDEIYYLQSMYLRLGSARAKPTPEGLLR